MTNISSNSLPLDKLPPQNIDLEESVLGALMLDKNVIVEIADLLEPEDFYRKAHQVIYEVILELFNNHEPIDILTLSNKLREKKLLEEIGGASYLTSLINKVPSTYHTEEYAKLIHKKRILRDLIAASYDISRLANNESENIDDVLDQAEQLVFQIAKKKTEQNFVQIKDELSKAFERIEMLQEGKGKLRGVTTGFRSLDNILGGLQKSDMIVLGARPSLGKTALVLDIARNAAMKGVGVGIFSLEMSKDQLVDRLISAESTVDLWKIRTGYLSSNGEMNDFVLLNDAISRLAEAPIYIDDTPGLTSLQIRTKARRLLAEADIGLLVIDYLQMIMPMNSYVGSVQQYTEISRSVKSLARELEIPILVVSQLSRNVEQRTPPIPKLSDLRETGCLAFDSLIMRADTGEVVKIKDLADRQEQVEIPVYTLDDNWKLVVKPLIKAFYSGKKMVYELSLKSGRTIKASANHPFRTLDGWVRLDELKTGDRLAVFNKNLNSPEIIWDEIVSIVSLRMEDVYDVTVQDTHNFIANDIIVHNSIEQDSDVVMLIYREDKYKKDSPNPNIAEILISKHRNGPVGQVQLYFNPEITSFRELDKNMTEEIEEGYTPLIPPDNTENNDFGEGFEEN